MRKFLKIFGVILFLLTISAFAVDRYLESLICGEVVISETASPDGKFVACLYSRDCGATTPVVTKVSIKRRLWLQWYTQKIDIFASIHQTNVDFRWISTNRLQISYRDGEVGIKKDGALGASIEYHRN